MSAQPARSIGYIIGFDGRTQNAGGVSAAWLQIRLHAGTCENRSQGVMRIYGHLVSCHHRKLCTGN